MNKKGFLTAAFLVITVALAISAFSRVTITSFHKSQPVSLAGESLRATDDWMFDSALTHSDDYWNRHTSQAQEMSSLHYGPPGR